MLRITPFERAALQLLASGEETCALAGCLRISESEVGPYLTTLFARMGVSSRSEAVAAAISRGLLAFPPGAGPARVGA